MENLPLQTDFSNLLSFVAANSAQHNRTSGWYAEFSKTLKDELVPLLENAMGSEDPFGLGEVGTIRFPWVSFGSINSGHLFGLDEMILFSFYWVNRKRYKKFLDLGANIGLHSLVASKVGMEATCVEPDPEHVRILQDNLMQNGIFDYTLHEGAATVSAGNLTFTRVEGNTTGSHVKGAKASPYGDLTEFEVEGFPVSELVLEKDLVKMDVEGLEADLLESIVSTGFDGFDLVAEIGSEASALRIWDVTKATEINLFSQKRDWSIVSSAEDLPHHHTEGSVFLSLGDVMSWR
jgi:FkbM family methyltransferase